MDVDDRRAHVLAHRVHAAMMARPQCIVERGAVGGVGGFIGSPAAAKRTRLEQRPVLRPVVQVDARAQLVVHPAQRIGATCGLGSDGDAYGTPCPVDQVGAG